MTDGLRHRASDLVLTLVRALVTELIQRVAAS